MEKRKGKNREERGEGEEHRETEKERFIEN